MLVMELHGDQMKIEPDNSMNKKKKYDCTCAIYAAMAESSIYKDYAGDGKLQLTDAHTLVMDLHGIEMFVKAALSTTKPAYLVTRHKSGIPKVTPSTLGNRLGRNFQPLRNMPDRKTVETVICGYRLSPNVNLYFDTLPGDGFWFTDPNFPASGGKLEAEYFNDFIDELRKNGKGQAYRNEQKKRRKQAADNHRSLTKYISALLDEDHYGRLAIFELDLAYINDRQNLVTIDVASAHRERFLGNRHHNKIFNNLVGYAWGLQYAASKGGYYQHFFMFFDCETQPDISWPDAIGAITDYWRDVITDGKGRGLKFDKVLCKDSYSGAFTINRGETAVIDGLIERAALYITQKEMFFSLQAYDSNQNKYRTFGQGKIPKNVQRYAGLIPN